MKKLKQQNPNLNLLLSVGGGGAGSEPFASIANSSSATEQLARTAKQMLDTYEFNGLDSEHNIVQVAS